MRLLGVKVIERGALRALASVELSCGLVLLDCPVFAGSSGPWAALPSRPSLDRAGHRIDRQYETVARWKSRELNQAWSDAVVALVRRHHPEVFGAAAA
jgi:DNA-binding cell septation regulator SpoVG